MEDLKPSTSEDMAIAFYRKVDEKPNFAAWARKSEKYNRADIINRSEILRREVVRLQQKYYDFDPARDILTISIPVRTSLTEIIGADEAQGKSYQLRFSHVEKGIDYFPYTVADMWFAVIVRGLEKNMTRQVGELEYKAFTKSWPKLRADPVTLTLRIHARVEKADAGAPVLVDGEHQWLMLMQIASMTVWDEDFLVWEYQAPWYETTARKDLRTLYRE